MRPEVRYAVVSALVVWVRMLDIAPALPPKQASNI